MTAPVRPASLRRATIAVVALYGLLLQAFLAAASPAAPMRVAGVICAPAESGSRGDHGQAGGLEDCCLAACLPLAPPASAQVVPTDEPAVKPLSWPARAGIAPPIPSTHAASARGPPIV